MKALRCRVCEKEYPALGIGICASCFGPLEPVYDWDALERTVSRETIEAGPQSLWRYAPLLPVAPPADASAGPGWTPLVPAPRLARELGVGEVLLKLDHTNPTHSFKDRVVAVAAAKARELGATTLACASTGNLANAVAARAAADGLAAVVLCASTVEPEKLIAEQLGWEAPDAVVAPIASGAMFTKLWQGFEQFRRLGLTDGPRPRLYGGQGAGCSPVALAFAEDTRVSPVRPNTRAHSLAIGNPADGDLAVATARASGGAIHAVPEDDIGENIALLAETAGVFGETAPGVTVGALRAAAASGAIGPRDRVVVLVTATGLKTPQAVPARSSVIEIEPNADAVLARSRVAA